MNIELTSTFKVLGKVAPRENKTTGRTTYMLMVKQTEDLGKISVPEEVYNGVKVDTDVTFYGVQTSFDGNTYISWKGIVPFKEKDQK